MAHSLTPVQKKEAECLFAGAAGEPSFPCLSKWGAGLPELVKLDPVNTITCYMFSKT